MSVRLLPPLLALLAVLAAGCGDDSSSVGEICNNGIDDDRDGITDCFDPDCLGMPACVGGTETDCADGLDDDDDGLTDCDDRDCAGDPACGTRVETVCDDGLDDDGDGATDCDDRDCADDPACEAWYETQCNNGLDDDRDGATDCDDPDCVADPACAPFVELDCNNRVDDDGDGFTDCDDRDCADDPACGLPPTETDCDNGADDDGDGFTDCDDFDCELAAACHELDCENRLDDEGDGLTDCGDPDCARDPACLPESDCTNGADDDGDGATDCDDPDCASDPACRPESSCDNDVDDDGDGFTDCDDPDCDLDEACRPACDDAADPFEDNDTRATAADGALVAPDDVLAVLPGDPDYFAIDVCPGAVVRASLEFVHALGDIDVTLETATGTRLASSTSGDDDESLSWTAASLGTVYLHVYLWDRDPSPCNSYSLTLTVDRAACPTGETDCANGLDEDGDGLTDCADTADCAADPVCSEEDDCTDGLDDDGDGLTDCFDPACCADPACVADPACTGGYDTCAAPYVLADDPEGTWRGDTTGMAADYTSTCGGGARGPDVVYQFELTERFAVTVDLSGSSYDTVAYLRGSECAAGATLVCDDDSGSDYDSRFSITLDPGTYHLFVDGYNTASGTFVLAISLADPEVCDDGLDNDGDGATDCDDPDCVGAPGCVETDCEDALDDDGDGATDCDDFDCALDAACLPASCAEDVHEDNDDRATATAWTAITSSEYLAVLAGDDDYFAIAVCPGAVVDIVARFVHAAGDIDLYLQNASGANLRTSGGATDREAIRWTSDRTGTVYLRVNLFGTTATCNSYRLSISVDESACP
ncbi:MAG: hypothetical protein JXB32_09940 [Deltaproteobacteria bacterium]|nr:hypothetical protein [Deltaproteobacteria bacterium]